MRTVLRLEHERRVRAWTQKSLGVLARIPQPTISDIERGEFVPNDDQLDRLARTLDVYPPSALLLPVSVHEVEWT